MELWDIEEANYLYSDGTANAPHNPIINTRVQPNWELTMGIETIALAAMAAGTGMQIAGTLQQGKDQQKIHEARAAQDKLDAQAVRDQSVEAARIKQEEGVRLRERQKSQAGAGGIRVNVGSPLVIEAETKALVAKDIGFVLERGRTQRDKLLHSAAIEKALGKKAKKDSVWNAVTQGIMGFGSIAMMGAKLPGSTSMAGSGAGSGVKSFMHGGGKLSSGSTSLFDFNAGAPALPVGGGGYA